MLTSSTKSIPLITIGQNGKRVVIFAIIKLSGVQPLSPAFMNLGIVLGLVYEHTTVEPVVVWRLNERNTLLGFVEGENIEKLCQNLSKYGWVAVYTLDVTLPHGNRWCWERAYDRWEEKKMHLGEVEVCSYLNWHQSLSVKGSVPVWPHR